MEKEIFVIFCLCPLLRKRKIRQNLNFGSEKYVRLIGMLAICLSAIGKVYYQSFTCVLLRKMNFSVIGGVR